MAVSSAASSGGFGSSSQWRQWVPSIGVAATTKDACSKVRSVTIADHQPVTGSRRSSNTYAPSSQGLGRGCASHSSRRSDIRSTSWCLPSEKWELRRVPSITKPAFSYERCARLFGS